MRTTLVVLCLTGCVTAPPKVPAEQAFRAPDGAGASVRPPRSAAAAERWARSFHSAVECEAEVRRLEAVADHDTAWAYMRGCLMRSDYGALRALLDGWAEDLERRPEAPSLLAQVIANRGGQVEPDLELVQNSRLPLFDLRAALAQPKAFEGRYVLVLGRVSKVREGQSGHPEFVLAEERPTSTLHRVQVPQVVATASTARLPSRAWGPTGPTATTSTTFGTGTAVRASSEFVDTGAEVWVRMTQADPFLPTEKDVVLLARFDGVRAVDVEPSAEAPQGAALVSLVSYHPCSPEGVVSW